MMNDDSDDRNESTDESSGIDRNRRTLVKSMSALTTAGALGSLAGCSTQSNNQEDLNQEGGINTQQSGDQSSSGESPGKESNQVDFWSTQPTGNPKIRKWFPKQIKDFENRHDNISVNLTPVTQGNIVKKIRTAIQSGSTPDIATSGALGIDLMNQGVTIDHSRFIEKSNYQSNLLPLAKEGAKFDGKWFATGTDTTAPYMIGLRPKFFKQVGIDEPRSQLRTWTDYRRALDKIKEKFPNVYPHEVTGKSNDLEVYWTEAHTAWKNGKDPWIDTKDKGSPDDPYVKIGKEPRTDGMIKNNIDLGQTYSSPGYAQRTDEETIPMLFSDRAASYHYGLGDHVRYKTVVDKDLSFGWDGDIFEMPLPKLDPNYGKEFDLPDLAGKEGQVGGNASSVGGRMIFKDSNVKQKAWELEKFIKTNSDFVIPMVMNNNPNPPTWQPAMKNIKKNHLDEMPQLFNAAVKALDEHPKQYFGTGAKWDIRGISTIRFTDINKTLMNAHAGRYSPEETPGAIREKVMKTIQEKN